MFTNACDHTSTGEWFRLVHCKPGANGGSSNANTLVDCTIDLQGHVMKTLSDVEAATTAITT